MSTAATSGGRFAYAASTPTGIEIRECDYCGKRHPVTRSHCTICDAASLFLNDEGECLNHNDRKPLTKHLLVN